MRYLDVQLRTLAPGNLLFAIQSGIGLSETIDAKLRLVTNDLITNASLDELKSRNFEKVTHSAFMDFCSKLGVNTEKFTLIKKQLWKVKKARKFNGLFRSVQHEDGLHERIKIRSETKILVGSLINPYNFGKSQPVISKRNNKHSGLAMHIRGGDYLTSMRGVYNLCSVDYYRAVLDIAGYADGEVCIFTNDCQYAKYIKSKLGLKRAAILRGDEIDDMMSMAEFESLAISNSTYSWWSAYIGNSKQIFTPDRFRNDLYDTQDLVMPGWKIISV